MKVTKIKNTNEIVVDIYDYNGYCTIKDIDLDKVMLVMLYELSGDEALDIYYKDGNNEWIDSSSSRLASIFDYSKILYINGNIYADIDEIIGG